MRVHIRFRATLAVFCAFTVVATGILPVPVLRVASHPQAATTRTVFRTFAPYWQVNGGYSSTLLIRNTDRESPATLTPVIFTSGSKQSRLAPIVVPPDAVQSLSLADALKDAGLSANWGALALEQSQAPPVTLLGEVRIENAEHSLIFNLPLHAGYVGGESKTLRGSWWLPDEETKGTIILLNTSDQELVIHPALRANWTERPAADISLKAHEIRAVDLADLLRENGLRDANVGSLSLVYEGPTNALLPSLLLFNEKSGFSLPGKFFPRQSSVPGQQTVWHFPAVFVNSADPAMGFKQNLKFTPYALLANHTTQPMPLDLTAHYEIPGTGGVQSATLALSPLGGLETRLVDLSEFLPKELIGKDSHSFNLNLTHPGATGDLGVQIISMDKSGNFVFPAEGSTEVARSFNAISWDISGNQRSLVELQNVTDSPVEASVTLTFDADGKNAQGTYHLPAVLLPPHATRLVNLKEILSAGQPDQDGKIVPPGVTFGTARVDTASELSDGALVAVGTIFDPILGTCAGSILCSTPTVQVLIDGFEVPSWSFYLLLDAVIIACEIGCDETTLPEVTLSCTSPVTRGQSSTCTISVTGARSGASISFSGWKFDGGGATVTRTTNQSSGSWSGVMVTSGTVSVTATINGTQFPASAAITVTDNTSLAFSPVNPTKVPNNFQCQTGEILAIPSPPVQGGAIGRGCVNLSASVTGTAEVTDGGPNHGYQYVTSVIDRSSQRTTEYDYTISADLENTSGAFFLAQCGTYNEQTNPLGFIGGAVLLSNTINHEIGPVDSHWNNYWRSQVSPATNTGIVLGRVTAAPGVSPEAFDMQLTNVIRSNFAVIKTMVDAEPCGSHAVERDPNNFCVFRGFINYPPFVSCK